MFMTSPQIRGHQEYGRHQINKHTPVAPGACVDRRVPAGGAPASPAPHCTSAGCAAADAGVETSWPSSPTRCPAGHCKHPSNSSKVSP